MHRAESSSQTTHPTAPPTEYQVGQITYRRRENGQLSRKCPECGGWIGLGPKGGLWSFNLHVNSASCVKEKERKASHPGLRTASNAEVPTSLSLPSPFTVPAAPVPTHSSTPGPCAVLPQQFTPSTLPPPGPYSQSALSSPQILSSPSYTHDLLTLPSLVDFKPPGQYSQGPSAVLSPPQKRCPGSLDLWEPGDPATTYPFNLHSYDSEGPAKLPWTVAVGERPRSLRLWSDSCAGVCDPSRSCCQPCAEITSSTQYHQVVDRAKNDCSHWAYDKLNWEQVVRRVREKNDLLVRERSKV